MAQIDDGRRSDEAWRAIAADPRYRRLVRRRGGFGWALSGVMIVAYVAFLLAIAFGKGWLAQPIGDGVTSLGIPVGFGLILLAVALTGWYVRRANREYDALVAALKEDAA